MKTILLADSKILNENRVKTAADIQDYYTEAGPDYSFWSKKYNMHFGYALNRWDCLSREKMLERMNEIVLNTLNIRAGGEYLDMGCGMGATLRFGGRNFPKSNFVGVTITKWQIENGNQLIQKEGLENTNIQLGDYHQLPFENDSKDGVYAIESVCHSPGINKIQPIREAHRVLKSGGRFTMVDGFLKKTPQELNALTRYLYHVVCDNWALSDFGEIHAVQAAFEDVGFKNINIEEISYKIAPSAVHAPFLTIFFLIKKKLKGEKLGAESWKNLKACMSIFFLGLFRKSIGYYRITANK